MNPKQRQYSGPVSLRQPVSFFLNLRLSYLAPQIFHLMQRLYGRKRREGRGNTYKISVGDLPTSSSASNRQSASSASIIAFFSSTVAVNDYLVFGFLLLLLAYNQILI